MTMKVPFADFTANQNGNRTLDEAISEIQREIDVRRRLYDRWVTEGKFSYVDGHDRLERMLTALKILLTVTEDDEPITGN